MTVWFRDRASFIVALCIGATLSACGGGSDGSSSTATATTATTSANDGSSSSSGSNSTDTASLDSGITISWALPTTNTDGTALTNLAGYHIHYGTDSSALDQEIDVPSPDLTQYVIQNLTAGTYYFSVSSYNTDGTEGVDSSLVSVTVA